MEKKFTDASAIQIGMAGHMKCISETTHKTIASNADLTISLRFKDMCA